MSRSLLFVIFLIGSLSLVGACHSNTLTLPQPAQAIEGVYEGANNAPTFPLAGQTIRLTIRQVKPDSAMVKVYGLINKQVTDSLSYPTALVSQEISNGCVSYRVYLPTGQRVDQLSMSCAELNVFQYYYQTGTNSFNLLLNLKKQ